MATEMNTLFNVLNCYKRSIVEILNKINDNVLQAISNHEDTHTSASIEKKYKLSMEMTKVLQTFVKMLYSIETLSEELGTKLFDLERDSQPQRGKRMSNPFILSACQESDAQLSSQLKVAFEQLSPENNESFSCDREPETDTSSKTPTGTGLTSPEISFVGDEKPKVVDLINFTSIDDCTSTASSDVIQPENVKIENDGTKMTLTSESSLDVEVKAEAVAEYVDVDADSASSSASSDTITPNNVKIETKITPTSESSLDVEVKADAVAEYVNVDTDSASNASSDIITPNNVKIETDSNPFNLNNSNCDLKPDNRSSSAVKKEDHIAVPTHSTKEEVEPLLKPVKGSPEVYRPKPSKRIAVRSPVALRPGSQRETYSNYSPSKPKTKGENAGFAEKKLMEMHCHNSRNEPKPPESESVKKKVKWLATPPKNSRQPQVQPKDKNAIFDIVENELFVNMDCTFSHVESPFEFYVRADQEMFEQLENHFNKYMNDHYSYVINGYKSKTEAKTRLGHFCFAFLSDTRKWYRIEVVDWMEDDDEAILVQLIDYGQKVCLSFKSLKSMNENYAAFPRMAIRCHLAGVYSSHPDSKLKWPKASVDYFIQLTEISQMAKFKAIFVHNEGGSYATDFSKAGEQDPYTLGQLLVHAGYASAIDIKSTDPLATIDEDDLEEHDTINEAIAGYDARDEARICPFTNNSGGCFKGAKCKLEHTKLSEDGITTDKMLITNQALKKFPLPQPGEHVVVLVTGYIDTCHFYAHILQNRDEDSQYNREFNNLKDAMMVNNMVQTYEPFKLFPTHTELVLVKEGSEWHRGACVDYINDSQVEVFLLDYGYTRIKKLNDLKQMKEEFLYVPFQAVQCILSDCQEKKDTHIVHSRNFFDRCMKGQKLHGLVVESSTEPISLQLWDAEGDMLLSHALIQCGIGEPRTDLRPLKDSILSTE